MSTPGADSTERMRELVGLGAILLVALLLRVTHIDWGVPGYVFPDSLLHLIRPAAAILAEGDLTLSRSQFFHPPVLVYALAGVFSGWSVLTGEPVYASGPAFQAQLPELVLLARGLGLAVALACIAVQYRLARRLLGSRVALFAAASFALAPIHVLESHRIHPDGLMLLLILLASDLAVSARDRHSRPLLGLAFAVAGLAGATKYVGLFGGAIPAFVAWTWSGGGAARRLARLAGGGSASLCGFAFGMLPAFFHLDRFLFAISLFANVGFVSGAPGYDLPGEGWASARFLYATFVALPFVLGWPLYLAGLAGLVVLNRRARAAFAIVLAFLLPYFLMQGGAAIVVARYFAPLVPFLTLAAGVAFDALLRSRGALGGAVAALSLAYTLALCASQVARMDQGTQRLTVASIVELARAERAVGRSPVLGYWGRWAWAYDTIRPPLEALGIRVTHLPQVYQDHDPSGPLPETEADWIEHDRRWIEEHGVTALLLASWSEAQFAREAPDHHLRRFYARLADGRLGFRLATQVEARYFTQPLYTWGDPMLEGHWETGIVGYKLFVRDDNLP